MDGGAGGPGGARPTSSTGTNSTRRAGDRGCRSAWEAHGAASTAVRPPGAGCQQPRSRRRSGAPGVGRARSIPVPRPRLAGNGGTWSSRWWTAGADPAASRLGLGRATVWAAPRRHAGIVLPNAGPVDVVFARPVARNDPGGLRRVGSRRLLDDRDHRRSVVCPWLLVLTRTLTSPLPTSTPLGIVVENVTAVRAGVGLVGDRAGSWERQAEGRPWRPGAAGRRDRSRGDELHRRPAGTRPRCDRRGRQGRRQPAAAADDGERSARRRCRPGPCP